MFSSTGLFKGIHCPEGTACTFLNCIFLHVGGDDIHERHGSAGNVSPDSQIAAEENGPPLKRRRVSQSDTDSIENTKEAGTVAATSLAKSKINGLAGEKRAKESQSRIHRPPATVERKASPPLRCSSAQPGEGQTMVAQQAHNKTKDASRRTDPGKVSLTPRLLTPNPAPHPVRLAILKKLHEQISRLNEEARRDQSIKRELVLSEKEVIVKALDEEEKAGKQNPQIYKNVVGHRIQGLKKMPLEEWKCSLLAAFQEKYLPPKSSAIPTEKKFETGLSSEEEIALLSHIATPLEGLEGHGYVTAAPTAEEIRAAQRGVEAAAGFERCDRCDSRFQVFPGRNTDEASKYFGRLTSTENGCAYHWAKLFRPPKASGGSGGAQESYHPCCRGSIGSKGCTEAKDHVFKVSEVKRLASVLQFQSTPWPEDADRVRGPVAFDCEMGYTTLGMEVLRLTAVSWPQHQRLLDILVRPLGEVIDYNTRFSGVSQDQFSKAPAYNKTEPASSAGKAKAARDQPTSNESPLQLVPSPAAARSLLFELLKPSMPLIGHAIENDLNVCRMIHPSIVDTVLLFPHPRGLPIRHGLKMLTNRHLDRSIQQASGSAAGHDSMQDARATGDLVRFKVLEMWKKMRVCGWRFETGGGLICPNEMEREREDKAEKEKEREREKSEEKSSSVARGTTTKKRPISRT